MSILIRGMDMPKACRVRDGWRDIRCPFFGAYEGGIYEVRGHCFAGYCRIEDKQMRDASKRPRWCPLKEVKDEHNY